MTYDTSTDDDSTRAQGTVQYVPTGKSADFADTNPLDVLEDVVSQMKSPYKTGAIWLANRRTFGAIRKEKDADGRSLWEQTLVAGQPSRLLGYPAIEAEDMPDIAANSYSLAFVNLREAYLIVDHTGIRVLRDPYTARPFVLFPTTKRVGGGVFNFEPIKLVKFAAS